MSRADLKSTWLPLAVVIVAFLGFAALYVPRLNNFQIGDIEFTGWVGPIAERVAAGETIYADFVLPIPPGAFVLLAWIQQLQGRALLAQELWVAAIAHLLMGLLGYAMVRPLTTRLNALLVVPATLAVVVQINKECTYDHTAQLCAWSSVALGAHALTTPAARRRRRRGLLALAGVAAGFTFFFKQSTGVGIVAGWGLGLVSLLWLGWRVKRAQAPDSTPEPAAAPKTGLGVGDALVVAGGLFLGLALVVLALVAVGAPLDGYLQAVFGDGPELKGGSQRLLLNLILYIGRQAAFPASLVVTVGLLAVLLRLVREPRGLDLDGETERREVEPTGAPHWLYFAVVVGAFGSACLLLGLRAERMPALLVLVSSVTSSLGTLGLFFFCAFSLGMLRRAQRERVGHGHVVLAITLVALVTSILHNASFPGFRPFYDNNPIIPLATMLLFVALDRARLGAAKWASFALITFGLLSPKLQRALSADVPVGRSGHWAGLKVNARGEEIVRAALRVRQLAGEDDSVLVLPEDVELRRLIGRPRPPVRGAILFVDQYPTRLLADDMAALRAHPPRVIVIHPGDRELWKTMFSLWSSDSATARLMRFVDRELLPGYVKDSTYRTVFFTEQAELEVWVRKR